MKTSIINSTLSEKDAYLRHELPRFEQSVQSLLTQVTRGLDTLTKTLDDGVMLTVKGERYEISANNISDYAPAQIKEAAKIKKELASALDKIGYGTAAVQAPAAAVGGAQVTESTSQSKGEPPLKTATITAEK